MSVEVSQQAQPHCWHSSKVTDSVGVQQVVYGLTIQLGPWQYELGPSHGTYSTNGQTKVVRGAYSRSHGLTRQLRGKYETKCRQEAVRDNRQT